MGNLLVENKDIKISKSAFAIYEDEITNYEGKHVAPQRFALNLNKGIFKGLEIEILNSVYMLKYSTSRQITEFLNFVKNIDENQGKITHKLGVLYNNNTVGRYSFNSSERMSDTSLKAYKLEHFGKRLLISRKYPCFWTAFDTSNVEEIKSYLARNQYILKVLEKYSEMPIKNSNSILQELNVNLNLKCKFIGAAYKVNNTTHIVIVVRKNTNNLDFLKAVFEDLERNPLFTSMINKKFIIISEDVKQSVEVFVNLYKSKIYDKYRETIYFTHDLRILDKELHQCFLDIALEKNEYNKWVTNLKEKEVEELK